MKLTLFVFPLPDNHPTQDVVATSHVPDEVLPEGEPALAQGLVFQKEINYFRRGRGGVVRTYIVP